MMGGSFASRAEGAPAGPRTGSDARSGLPLAAAPFPKQRVSLRQAAGGRAVLEAECGFGLALVPVDETRTRLAPSEAQDGSGGDRRERVRGVSLYHAASGMKMLPDGWFFTSMGSARMALADIGQAFPTLFDTHDINKFSALSGPVMAICRRAGAVAGKWHDISSALAGFDQDAWSRDADARAERMAALRDDPANMRRNAEAA